MTGSVTIVQLQREIFSSHTKNNLTAQNSGYIHPSGSNNTDYFSSNTSISVCCTNQSIPMQQPLVVNQTTASGVA